MSQRYIDPPANALNPGMFSDANDDFSFSGYYNSVMRVNDAAEAWSHGDQKAKKTVFNAVVLASKKRIDLESKKEVYDAYVRIPFFPGEPDPPSKIPLLADVYQIQDEVEYEQYSSWNQIYMHSQITGVSVSSLGGTPLKPKDTIKINTSGDSIHFLSRVPTPEGLWDRLYSEVQDAKPAKLASESPDLPTAPEEGSVARTPGGLELTNGKPFKHAVDRSAPVENDNGGQPAKADQINMVVLTESETYAKEVPDLKSGGRKEMHKVLTARKASVHYSVGLDGSVVQHEDPKTRVTFHSGGRVKGNYGIDGRSIGIEIINRVRLCSGEDSAEKQVGQPVCKKVDNVAAFNVEFNKYGQYRNPTMEQHEAVYNLLLELESQFPALELHFDLTSEVFSWGNDPSFNGSSKGVFARGKFLKSYTDGLATQYYCICRARGYIKQTAYQLLVDALNSSSPSIATPLPSSANTV